MILRKKIGDATLLAEPFFACSILVYLRKILHQSSTYKIFVEHTWHVITLKDTVFNQSGLAMTIGLQTNGCSHSKKQFERENKIDLFEVIQTEPHFFLLTQEDKRRHYSQDTVIYTSTNKVFLLAITCKSKRQVKKPQTSYQN